MVGVGENYFAAFALALGVGQALSGLVTTAPLFLGAILQMVSPWGVSLLGSHRRWVVACASTQALTFLPLSVGAWTGNLPATLLFAVLAVYWGAGMATMPAWNTWVGRLVPTRVRAPFFATRTRICQAMLLAGFLAAGLTLQIAQSHQLAMAAFGGLFMMAMALRLVSSTYLARQREAVILPAKPLTVRAILTRFRGSSEGRLLLYLVAIQAAVQVSGPYFTPFMLKQLHLPYASYAVLIGTSFFAKIVAVSFWGKVAHRYGARRLMWFGGLGVIPIAALWLVSQSFWYLVLVQTLSGVCWAAYELALFLLLFDSIREDERVSMLTAYNLANSTATCVGSLFGGLLLVSLGQNHTAYLAVFGVSSIFRLLTVLLLVRVPTPAAIASTCDTSTEPRRWYRTDAPHRLRPRRPSAPLPRGPEHEPAATAL